MNINADVARTLFTALAAIVTVTLIGREMVTYQGPNNNDINLNFQEAAHVDMTNANANANIDVRPPGAIIDPNYDYSSTPPQNDNPNVQKTTIDTLFNYNFVGNKSLSNVMSICASEWNKDKFDSLLLKLEDQSNHTNSSDEGKLRDYFETGNKGILCLMAFEKLVGSEKYNVSSRLFDLEEAIKSIIIISEKFCASNETSDARRLSLQVSQVKLNFLTWYKNEFNLVYILCTEMSKNVETIGYRDAFQMYQVIVEVLNTLDPGRDEKISLPDPFAYEEDSDSDIDEAGKESDRKETPVPFKDDESTGGMGESNATGGARGGKAPVPASKILAIILPVAFLVPIVFAALFYFTFGKKMLAKMDDENDCLDDANKCESDLQV